MNIKKRNNWLIKLGLSLFVLIVIYTLTFLINPYSLSWFISPSQNMALSFLELSISLLFSLGIIEGSTLIAKILEPRIPWAVVPIKRFIIQTFLIIVLVMLLIYFQGVFYSTIYGDTRLSEADMLVGWQFVIVSVITALFVNAIHTGYSLLKKWKDSITESKDLEIKALEFKEIAMNAELESL